MIAIFVVLVVVVVVLGIWRFTLKLLDVMEVRIKLGKFSFRDNQKEAPSLESYLMMSIATILTYLVILSYVLFLIVFSIITPLLHKYISYSPDTIGLIQYLVFILISGLLIYFVIAPLSKKLTKFIIKDK